MNIELPDKTNSTETPINNTVERSMLDGYYDPVEQTIAYPRFIQDLRIAIGVDGEKVAQYLTNNLLSIQKDTLIQIIPSDTSDENVRLMQEKLADLGSAETPLRNQSFLVARAPTISTFKGLQAMIPIIRAFTLRASTPDKILATIVNDQLVKKQTTQKTEYFDEADMRQEVRNSNGVLISPSLDAFVRANGIPLNEQGKVTQKEMGTIVLPSIRKLINNIAKRTPAFKS